MGRIAACSLAAALIAAPGCYLAHEREVDAGVDAMTCPTEPSCERLPGTRLVSLTNVVSLDDAHVDAPGCQSFDVSSDVAVVRTCADVHEAFRVIRCVGAATRMFARVVSVSTPDDALGFGFRNDGRCDCSDMITASSQPVGYDMPTAFWSPAHDEARDYFVHARGASVRVTFCAVE